MSSASPLQPNVYVQAERQLQQGINKINKWATINGFKISKTKTQGVHFRQLRKMLNNSTLNLDGSEILVVDQYKFLCVILFFL